MSMLVVYVARLVPLWKERYDVVDAIMEALREERTLSVDRFRGADKDRLGYQCPRGEGTWI